MIRRLLTILAVTLMLVTAGCGKKQPDIDTAPLQEAIVSYLRTQSMGLQVRDFKEVTVDGDTATAKVALSAADEDIAQVQVRWTFTFEKQDDGSWLVTGRQE